MIFDFSVIWDSLPLYFDGLLVTLKLLSISLLIGLLLAVPLALMRVSKQPLVNFPAWLYTYVIRGTPMLVQLFLIYYGLAQFDAVRESALWPWLSNASFCACLAFAINTSAYTAEPLGGSLKATPHGEIEAAKAMGMSRLKMYRRILLPSALRRALPQYSNEVIMMLQNHQPGVHRHPGGHHRRRADRLLAVLPAVRGVHHRRPVLPVPDLHPGAPVQACRAPLAGLPGAAQILIRRTAWSVSTTCCRGAPWEARSA